MPPEDKDRPSSKDPKPAGDGLAYKPQGLVSTTMTISPGEPSPSQRSPGGAELRPQSSSLGVFTRSCLTMPMHATLRAMLLAP